ncbi:MAG: TRAP transporter substrate-binding protein [Spirochaetales bacterium]|jgi:C4-dicarboxylate-binding protein DctP|nr:TRAP transporter substrate-binding protein [Spirochaetales bacterium]
MKKCLILLLAAVIAAPALMAAGAKEEGTYQLRTSTNLAAGGTIGKGLTKYTELVNAKAGGRIKAVANYGAELGNQREQVEMARGGSLEMVVAAPGTGPGTWVPELMMFEFPYIFKDNTHYRRVLKGLEAEVSARVRPFGFVAAAGQSQGSRHMLTVNPVTKLADMKGLRMRGPNAVYISMFTHLGAAGTTMDWNEIYTALQSKVIDGMEASPSMINSMKFQDVAKNLTITNHIIACVYYFYNEKWLAGLPEDLRKIVLDCADEAADYQARLDDADQDDSLKAMIAAGLKVHELSDAADWVTACSPMLAEYRAKGEQWNSFIDKMLVIK